MSETPQPHPEDNSNDQERIKAEFDDIIGHSFTDEEIQSIEAGEALTSQARLVQKLREIAPDDEYAPDDKKYTDPPKHILYVDGDPKHKIIVNAAADRHHIDHQQGRNKAFYWVFHSGSIDQMLPSDLPSAITPDFSLDREQAAAKLLELLDRSSPDKPEKTRRMFGSRVLSRLTKQR